jgi:hypothetical protein
MEDRFSSLSSYKEISKYSSGKVFATRKRAFSGPGILGTKWILVARRAKCFSISFSFSRAVAASLWAGAF